MAAAEWVSQADAVKLLAELGDVISQPALSQYLKGHPEVGREELGPGKGVRIDFASLRQSRETRRARGPSSEPSGGEVNVGDELSRRRAKADTETAEHNARRARILADIADGTAVRRDVAESAFRAAGAALVRAMEERRRLAVEAVRLAPDLRAADLEMRAYERAVRGAFAAALTDLAIAAEPSSAAAQ